MKRHLSSIEVLIGSLKLAAAKAKDPKTKAALLEHAAGYLSAIAKARATEERKQT